MVNDGRFQLPFPSTGEFTKAKRSEIDAAKVQVLDDVDVFGDAVEPHGCLGFWWHPF